MITNMRAAMPWIYLLSFSVFASVGPYLTQELNDRNVSNLGLILALPYLFGLLISPLWAIASDLFQAWGAVLKIASAFSLCGIYILAFLDIRYALLGMAVHALGRCTFAPLIDSLALRSVNGDAKEYGKLRLWGSLGFMLGILFLSATKQWFQWSALTFGAVVSAFFFVVVLFLPPSEQLKTIDYKKALKVIITDKIMGLTLLAAALHFGAHAASGTFLAIHIDSLQIETIWTGVSIAAGVSLEIILLAKSRQIMNHFSATSLFLTATIVACARWIGMHFADTGWEILLCQLTHGVTFGLFWIAAISIVSDRSPDRAPATGQGLLAAAVGGIGSGGGVWLADLAVRLQSTRLIYVGAAVSAWLAAMIVWRIHCIYSPKTQIGEP